MTEPGAAASTGARWQTARIVEIVPRTPRIRSFLLALPRPFVHRAGQHVDVRLTAPDGYTAVRSYSIASAPDPASPIELIIERLDDGEVSPFFHEVARVGDEIELRGPLGGHFVWSEADGGPLLLVGGGSGVAPLMSMIRYRASLPADVDIVLLLSARGWDEIPFREELLGLARTLPGFQLVLTLTRERPRRPADLGRRVDAEMIQASAARLPSAPRHVFVCGSNAFVNAAADGALASGIPATIIRTERYGA